jgi:hypothetical protein
MPNPLPAWPTDNHPLNSADAERSKARVSDIELGLSGDDMDRWYWRQKLDQRIRALEEDGKIYGLTPHEEVELERLKALRDKEEAQS